MLARYRALASTGRLLAAARSAMLARMTLLDIAFLRNFVEHHGFWALTLICMVPMVAFTLYVKFDDARQAAAHKRESRGH
jgi:hypothetical protein